MSEIAKTFCKIIDLLISSFKIEGKNLLNTTVNNKTKNESSEDMVLTRVIYPMEAAIAINTRAVKFIISLADMAKITLLPYSFIFLINSGKYKNIIGANAKALPILM